jgi:hypothetical protein
MMDLHMLWLTLGLKEHSFSLSLATSSLIFANFSFLFASIFDKSFKY